MSYIISTSHLNDIIHNEKVITIDVRANLLDPDYGKTMYKQAHLPGAYYLDLEKDLSGKVKKHGGNHPLPHIDQLVEKVRTFGMTNDSTVIVYDSGGEMFAPRAWWLFRYLGHEKVFVLDGGYDAWVRNGFTVTDEMPTERNGLFTANLKENRVVSMEEVKRRNEQAVLIDSRAWERYIGKEEPLYAKAGHIPGAINYNWEDVFTEEGLLKDKEELMNHFKALPKDSTIIVSCGSGVSACANILALNSIGYDNIQLYAGSFSDWISYPENELNVGEEP